MEGGRLWEANTLKDLGLTFLHTKAGGHSIIFAHILFFVKPRLFSISGFKNIDIQKPMSYALEIASILFKCSLILPLSPCGGMQE